MILRAKIFPPCCLSSFLILFFLLTPKIWGQEPSRLPPDVVLDYSYDAVHLLNGAGNPLYPKDPRYDLFLKRLRQYPPEILIVGKESPFSHSLGPILSFGGENRIFPPIPPHLQEDPRRLLTPQELRYRIQAIRQFVKDAHSAGVRYLLPYLSPVTMFADPKRKSGFLAFYSQWDQYASLYGLGPRPSGDPMEWVQRDFNGKPSFRFAPNRPEYSPFSRYSMCINAPGWRQWLKILTQWTAKVGYDGLFMDNALEHRCYCSYCQQKARKLGVILSPSSPRSQLVWLTSYLDFLNELRQTFKSLRSKFYCAVNYPEIPFQEKMGDTVDLLMIERAWLGPTRYFWPQGMWPGLYPPTPAEQNTSPSQPSASGQIQQNIWLMQLAYALRGRRGIPFLLTSPMKVGKEYLPNEDSALLALAEGTAFGGGIAVHVVGNLQGVSPFLLEESLPVHKTRKRFFSFTRKYPFLFKDLYPSGDIALLVFPNQGLEGLLEAQQVHQNLLGKGLLVDVLNGTKVTPQTLKSYSLILVPGNPSLPSWMLHLPLLRSSDPLHPSDWTPLLKRLQKGGSDPGKGNTGITLRKTPLSTQLLKKLPQWRVLYFPSSHQVEGCAWSNHQRLVLHLLHYQIPLGTANGRKVIPVPSLLVRLTLPEGKRVEKAFFYTPTSPKPLPLRLQQKGKFLTFTITQLRVYGICELRFRKMKR